VDNVESVVVTEIEGTQSSAIGKRGRTVVAFRTMLNAASTKL
jgi:predicted RNA-binding protein YlqC (UPF0109 family)